jgi:hypothetical protein
MNPGLTVTRIAVGAIKSRRFVRPSKTGDATVSDQHYVQASASSDLMMGASVPNIDAADGDHFDVVLEGLAEIEAGGAIAAGAYVTSDANGKAVTCTPAAGAKAQSGGTAYSAATADGDFILVHLARTQVTTPAVAG